VAVKVNDKWLFFDPSTPFLENGMLRWQEEGQSALISDPKEGFFTKTQYLEPVRSARQRRATLNLLDDGTLEGTVQLTYTGHIGREQKIDLEDKTAAQQEEEWKKSLQARLSTADISDFTVEQAADPVKPLVVKYKVSIPGCGTRTGKRLLLQPAFFERNVAARFTDSKRKWNVYFEYPWSEDDEVSIELPDGWELDQPVAPNGNTIKDLGEYSVKVSKTDNGRKILYRRKFDWQSEHHGAGFGLRYLEAGFRLRATTGQLHPHAQGGRRCALAPARYCSQWRCWPSLGTQPTTHPRGSKISAASRCRRTPPR
jgi:hypothetical protein